MTRPPGTSRLFPDSHATPPAGVYLANIDGASRGNPGPASYAMILRDAGGKVVFQLCKKLGRQTNNVAEYYALLAALDYAATNGIRALRIRSDSELLVRQIQGRYKVKSADLKPLHERATKLSRQLVYFAIEHVRRELNRAADALANVALDSGPVVNGVTEAKSSARATVARSKPRRIRATFAGGVLVPVEPLDLPEGSEVIVELREDSQD